MGYYIKYALVVKTDNHPRVKEILGKINACLEEQGEFTFVEDEYKDGWDSPKEVLDQLREEFEDSDSVVAYRYLAIGEQGEEVHEDAFESKGYQDHGQEDIYGWIVNNGYAPTVGEVSGIAMVYVDLESGTILNGPIAKVPVNRITEDMGDAEVIQAATPYRLWNV